MLHGINKSRNIVQEAILLHSGAKATCGTARMSDDSPYASSSFFKRVAMAYDKDIRIAKSREESVHKGYRGALASLGVMCTLQSIDE